MPAGLASRLFIYAPYPAVASDGDWWGSAGEVFP